MRIASCATSHPDIAEATSRNLPLAALRFSSYSWSVAGVKLFSKPFGVTTSTCLPRKCSHSIAVISLTVVNTSAFSADFFSREWSAVTLNCLAFSSALYDCMESYSGRLFPARQRPTTVAWVVNTVAIGSFLYFRYRTPAPVCHSWNCATTLSAGDRKKLQ
ncbi:unknown [Bacteroides sp. CAG:545]|nr:unknown [Bacteroides sp. CAG:545]